MDTGRVKPVIRSLLISTRDQIMNVQQLERDFITTEGSSIPYARFGYSTLFDFLCSMPDVLNVYGNGRYAFVQPVAIPSIQHVQQLVQRNRQTHNRYKEKAPINVLQPIRNQHKRMPLTEQSPVKNKFPEGVKSAHAVDKKVASKTMKTGIPQRITCDHTNERLDAETPCYNEMDWIDMLTRPKEAMDMSSVIPEPGITSIATIKGTLLVRILHVMNPNRIWVRFNAHNIVFEKLQNEMNTCYTSKHTANWNIIEFPQGLYCAALLGTNWYRGIIVGPKTGGYVKVNLIDLGMVEFIDVGAVKFLSKHLSKPGVLAVRASLAYLVPKRYVWSRADSDHLEMMLDKSEQFGAIIVNYDEGHNAVDIVLRGANMANVNKTFASEVQATYAGSDEPTGEDIINYRQRYRTFNEKYPTFHCIEVGHFPTVGEMRRTLKRNFDFEKYYAQIPHNPEINIPQQFKMTRDRIAEILNWLKNNSQSKAAEGRPE